MSTPYSPVGLPGPETSMIFLGNFLPTATKFEICGSQGGKVQKIDVTVEPFSHKRSQGWDAGPDKMVTVKTPYFTRCFCPFTIPEIVAVFRR